MIDIETFEKMYFFNRIEYLNQFIHNPFYKFICILSDNLMILKLMNESVKSLIKETETLASHIRNNNDPMIWKSKEGFEIETIAVKHILYYLSINQSQIDINRRLYKKVKKHYPMGDIDAIKEKLINLPEVQFTNNLRNYLQHYSIPSVKWEVHIDYENKRESFNLIIENKDLFGSNSFEKIAQSFIDSNKKIMINNVICKSLNYLFDYYNELCRIMLNIDATNIKEYIQLFVYKEEIIKKLRREEYSFSTETLGNYSDLFYKNIINRLHLFHENIDELSFVFYKLKTYLTV